MSVSSSSGSDSTSIINVSDFPYPSPEDFNSVIHQVVQTSADTKAIGSHALWLRAQVIKDIVGVPLLSKDDGLEVFRGIFSQILSTDMATQLLKVLDLKGVQQPLDLSVSRAVAPIVLKKSSGEFLKNIYLNALASQDNEKIVEEIHRNLLVREEARRLLSNNPWNPEPLVGLSHVAEEYHGFLMKLKSEYADEDSLEMSSDSVPKQQLDYFSCTESLEKVYAYRARIDALFFKVKEWVEQNNEKAENSAAIPIGRALSGLSKKCPSEERLGDPEMPEFGPNFAKGFENSPGEKSSAGIAENSELWEAYCRLLSIGNDANKQDEKILRAATEILPLTCQMRSIGEVVKQEESKGGKLNLVPLKPSFWRSEVPDSEAIDFLKKDSAGQRVVIYLGKSKSTQNSSSPSESTNDEIGWRACGYSVMGDHLCFSLNNFVVKDIKDIQKFPFDSPDVQQEIEEQLGYNFKDHLLTLGPQMRRNLLICLTAFENCFGESQVIGRIFKKYQQHLAKKRTQAQESFKETLVQELSEGVCGFLQKSITQILDKIKNTDSERTDAAAEIGGKMARPNESIAAALEECRVIAQQKAGEVISETVASGSKTPYLKICNNFADQLEVSTVFTTAIDRAIDETKSEYANKNDSSKSRNSSEQSDEEGLIRQAISAIRSAIKSISKRSISSSDGSERWLNLLLNEKPLSREKPYNEEEKETYAKLINNAFDLEIIQWQVDGRVPHCYNRDLCAQYSNNVSPLLTQISNYQTSFEGLLSKEEIHFARLHSKIFNVYGTISSLLTVIQVIENSPKNKKENENDLQFMLSNRYKNDASSLTEALQIVLDELCQNYEVCRQLDVRQFLESDKPLPASATPNKALSAVRKLFSPRTKRSSFVVPTRRRSVTEPPPSPYFSDNRDNSQKETLLEPVSLKHLYSVMKKTLTDVQELISQFDRISRTLEPLYSLAMSPSTSEASVISSSSETTDFSG